MWQVFLQMQKQQPYWSSATCKLLIFALQALLCLSGTQSLRPAWKIVKWNLFCYCFLMMIFFIQRKQVVLCNCNSYKLLLLNHWTEWFWITLLLMCHWGKPLLHALVKYKSLTNSHGNKPDFVWKILPLWKWVSPVPICGAWPPPPCQKELAQAKLLVCPHSVSSAVHGERGGLSPPAVIGNPWAPCDWQPMSSLWLGDVGGGPGTCKHWSNPLLSCRKGAGGGVFHFLILLMWSFPWKLPLSTLKLQQQKSWAGFERLSPGVQPGLGAQSAVCAEKTQALQPWE